MVFAHILGWPEGGLVQLGSVTPNPAIKVILTVKVDDDSCNETVIQRLPPKSPASDINIQVSLLGFEGLVDWVEGSGLVAIEVQLPDRWEKTISLL